MILLTSTLMVRIIYDVTHHVKYNNDRYTYKGQEVQDYKCVHWIIVALSLAYTIFCQLW